ncbi:MAG: MBL fold metallo-hydrolase [Deltaproteobacteria bacterium]|nr:MBL fold metallo-hydrolase [Deltaproteobacteria bacterium]
MHIQFIGAARTVTGSMHVLDTGKSRILLDCGLFQGRRAESTEINRKLRVDASSLDAVVLSHAHIDHSGALPRLFDAGFQGQVFSTSATCALLDPMLRDAARIQMADADFINRRNARHGSDDPPVVPLYEEHDVEQLLERLQPVDYHQKRQLTDDVAVTFFDAGHVLGSAVCVFEIKANGASKRVVFSGDLGRRNAPILNDPELVDGGDMLIMESTYGDRLHEPIHEMDEQLAKLIEETLARRGKVIIPSFALERAQEVLHAITRLQKIGRLKPIPIVLDSPLTVKLTTIFGKHKDCFDEETMALIQDGRSPFEPRNLRYIETVDDSRSISESDQPCVVISASGMLEAGRVVHHLRAVIGDPNSVVAIVGFQAQHTLGRRLLEGRTKVKIFGVEYQREVRVVQLAGFSAHADRADLVAYADGLKKRGGLRKIALVHGEPESQKGLIGHLKAAGHSDVVAPATNEKIEF